MTALLVLILTLSVRPADAQLTTAESVRISFRNAAGPPRPVRLENVVVTCVSAGFKHFFVQDKTGGVQVRVPENLWPKNLVVGDVVSVTGVADNNLFRAVTAAKVERAGRQEKLKPAVFDLTPTHANVLDGMLVATRGTVRNKQVIDGLTTLTLSRPGGEVKVVFAGGLPPDIAVGATIDVQGVCATDFGRDRRVQVPTRIVVSDSTPPVLNAAAPPSLFDTKPVALKTVTELAAYLGERRHLVRLTGVLTARAGGKVFVQDAKGGVPVVLVAGQTSLTHGTLVDVVGAPAKIDGMYGLENSQIRQSADGTPVPPVAPVAVPLGDLAGDGYLARLVRVEGTVIDVSFSLGRMRLSVFDRGQFAEAFLDAPRASDGVVPGSRVALVGVCDADGAGGVVLRLRADDDVELLRGPPFWTGDRVWALLGGFGAVCLFGAVVVVVLRTQVRRATGEIRQQFDERVELQEKFVEASRLEAVGRLAGGVAHEFNNLLTVINGCATLLTESVDGGKPAELADDIRRAGERAADLSGQLLTISRPRAVVPQPMDLNASVRNTTHLIGRAVGDQIALRIDTDVTLPVVKADAGLVSQIIFNLTMNARDAMPDGGTITIRTATLVEGPVTWARLTVSDTGTGMTDEVRARMFEPFFTTKGAGSGTGLGLALVHAHVQSLGGRIRCESAPGRGTTFEVDLPTTASVTDDMTPLPPPLALPTPLSDEFATVVLVVEDDEAVRTLAKRILELRGITVLTAAGPADALRASDEYRERIDLVLTDLSMPEMSGRELADQLRGRRLGLRVVYMSGFTAEEAIDQGLIGASAAFVQKPFGPAKLIAEVSRALGTRA